MSTGGSDRNAEKLAAIEQAYSQWGGGLFRFAVRLCGNREDAEDVVVETFAQAYLKWETYYGTGSRRAWLYGIAVNCCRMTKRGRKLKLEPLTEELRAGTTSSLDRIDLQRAIAKLSVSQREAFLLVKGEGLTSKEAAEILGRPQGTVLYEVFQAIRGLRAALEEKGPDARSSSRLCEVEP